MKKGITLLFLCLFVLNANAYQNTSPSDDTMSAVKGFLLGLGVLLPLSIAFIKWQVNSIAEKQILKKLTKDLETTEPILKMALKNLSKEYKIKKERKILIVGETDRRIAVLRDELIKDGFYRHNIDFAAINSTIDFSQFKADVIVFNDKFHSKITQDQIEHFVKEHYQSVSAYFYLGTKYLPVDDWRIDYKIYLLSARFELTLGDNLFLLLKKTV